MASTPNTPEPTPQANAHPAIWDLVVADMRERDRIGLDKYRTRLQPHNGRCAATGRLPGSAGPRRVSPAGDLRSGGALSYGR